MTCASVFATAREALSVPCGRVELWYCADCGMIFNPLFDPALAEIGARYESSQAASAHFGQFARTLARTWIERNALAGKRVLEIGCGRGEFLQVLLAEGLGSGVGLDPLVDEAAARGSAGSALELRAERFDEHCSITADAAVCRHTLEHIGPVADFLGELARWARRQGEGRVLFEVPAAERVLSEFAFWDVYYEHCSYFTADTMRSAFELAGFEVLSVEKVYGDQYLILDARVRGIATAPSRRSGTEDLANHCESFGREARLAVQRCDESLERLAAAGRPVVLWQGAAKTVGFLSAIGRRDLIHSAVDLSPNRHGQFLPGSGLPVHAPEELVHIDPAHVVLMNPVYVGEVQARLDSLKVRAKLMTINDLCSGTAPSS